MVLPNEENKIAKLLSRYKNIPRTTHDIMEVLKNYHSLSYGVENFVFNDGSCRNLFNMHGTIPVVYKNNTYFIPICMWIMDTYPNNAPLCFVKPTPDMHIKVSMYVDHNGKIYLPYLHDWQPSISDLMGVIQVMIVTFGDQPPVYSKPKDSVNTQYPPQTFMPQPGGNTAGSYLPYPAASGGGYSPYPPNTGAGYPPYPPQTGNQNVTPMGTNFPPYMPPYPGSPGYANYNASNQEGTIKEEHIKASLISAVEDKLKRRMQERVNQFKAEIETLERTKQELTEGRAKINEIIKNLSQEEIELQSNINVLKGKDLELTKSLETLEEKDGIDVDEAVITTAPLYRQLLNAYAEEAATEDAIYYMGEALRSGVIDLEVYLKHVRQLSRKQFILRALMQKCRQKAGLAG